MKKQYKKNIKRKKPNQIRCYSCTFSQIYYCHQSTIFVNIVFLLLSVLHMCCVLYLCVCFVKFWRRFFLYFLPLFLLLGGLIVFERLIAIATIVWLPINTLPTTAWVVRFWEKYRSGSGVKSARWKDPLYGYWLLLFFFGIVIILLNLLFTLSTKINIEVLMLNCMMIAHGYSARILNIER